jgi:prevent-host-death family protein
LVTIVVDQLDLVNMTRQVNVQDAKTRLSELLVKVEQGEEIVIARNNKPVARLVPVAEAPLREVGFIDNVIVPREFFDELPESELAAWEGR